MKTYQNRYYPDFPVHFYSIDRLEDKFELVFYNVDSHKVEEITLAFGKEECILKVNSNEAEIKHTLEYENVENNAYKPVLISCKVNSKEYAIKDFKDVFTISQPESVYSLGYERFLYSSLMSKAVNSPRSDIQYVAKKNDYFWTCTCGTYNLNSFDECTNCKKHKKDTFSVEIPTEEKAKETEYNIWIYKSSFIWLFVMFIVQLFYQSFYGTYLFENQAINEFYPVLNRFIVPVLLLVSNIVILFSTMYYKKILKNISYVIFFGSILYLNVITLLSFINTAYSLLMLGIVNIYVVAIFYQNLKNRKLTKFLYGLLVFVLLSSGFTAYQWNEFGNYDLVVKPSGLLLNVHSDSETYVIPDEINNVKVSQVKFLQYSDYLITDLTIGKNVEDIYIFSTAVLPELEDIHLVEGNPNFYIQDNVLYNNDGTIDFVPISVTSLTVNVERIYPSEYRDLYYLEELIIGPNVRFIDESAFLNALSLNSIVIDENTVLENIGSGAFANCQSLESIDLPISLQFMGLGVFENCNNLTYIRSPFLGEERETTDILSQSSDVLVYFFGSRTYLMSDKIPNALETVEIYDIDRIHNVTFYNANYVQNIILTDSLVSMGIRSFYGCESLESFIVPDGITLIKESAFEASGIQTITIPDTVVYIDNNAFKNCDELVNVVYEGDVNDLVISNIGNEDIIDILYPAG